MYFGGPGNNPQNLSIFLFSNGQSNNLKWLSLEKFTSILQGGFIKLNGNKSRENNVWLVATLFKTYFRSYLLKLVLPPHYCLCQPLTWCRESETWSALESSLLNKNNELWDGIPPNSITVRKMRWQEFTLRLFVFARKYSRNRLQSWEQIRNTNRVCMKDNWIRLSVPLADGIAREFRYSCEGTNRDLGTGQISTK